MGLRAKIYLLSPVDAILSSTLFVSHHSRTLCHLLPDREAEPYLKDLSLSSTNHAFKKAQPNKYIHTYISTKYVLFLPSEFETLPNTCTLQDQEPGH